MEIFGVELEKYFDLHSSHFVAYDNFREPVHGHNYKVSLKIKSKNLSPCCLVVDFGDLKKILVKICDELNNCVLLPKFNKYLKITENNNNYNIE
jgi:6-pyruvoyl-tetrahydropterin synthase